MAPNVSYHGGRIAGLGRIGIAGAVNADTLSACRRADKAVVRTMANPVPAAPVTSAVGVLVRSDLRRRRGEDHAPLRSGRAHHRPGASSRRRSGP